MEAYLQVENWRKKDIQFVILQSVLVVVLLHYGITTLLPRLISFVQSVRNTSFALSEIEQTKAARFQGLTTLEEDAERLRVEVMTRCKVRTIAPTPLVTSPEGRFRLSSLRDDSSSDVNIGQMKENSSNNRVARGAVSSNKYRLGQHVVVDGTDDTAVGHHNFTLSDRNESSKSISKPMISSSSTRASDRSSLSSNTIPVRSPATQYMYTPAPSHNTEGHEVDRRAMLSEQDLEYEVSLRTDRTNMLLQQERVDEFERIVEAYCRDLGGEPDLDTPDAVTVIFKISDEVYARATNKTAAAAAPLKHKKISRRFLLSDSAECLFSFIFCHIYEFSAYPHRYLGRDVQPLFCPHLPPPLARGDSSWRLQDWAELPSFDLICSYPRLEITSSAVFFGQGGSSCGSSSTAPSVGDLGIKSNTLLTLRPSE